MLATGYGEQAALQTIKAANLDSDKGRVTVACVNSPASTTLSGDEPAIDYLQNMLITGGVFARKLKVETAYHSHHMEKVADSYRESLRELVSCDAREDVAFFSSVTGFPKSSDFGAGYWVDNLVSQVWNTSLFTHNRLQTRTPRFSFTLCKGRRVSHQPFL